MITVKVTRVAPIFPCLKAHSQSQYDEKSYSPKKRVEQSFKVVLEKELQPKTNTKLNILC